MAEAVAALVPVSDAADALRELAAYLVRPVRRHDGDEDGGESDDALLQRMHQRLQRKLPSYMVPSFLDVVTALPTMPSGKVDRTRLPVPTGRRPVSLRGPAVVAEGELEVQVRAAWAEALGMEPESLSVEANFFTDMGGHSLLAATVRLFVTRAQGRRQPRAAGPL